MSPSPLPKKEHHIAFPSCTTSYINVQGRRQVKICGVDGHGKRGTYNGGLEAEPTPLPPPPVKTRRIVSISGATSSKSGGGHVHPSPSRGDATVNEKKVATTAV